MLEQFSELLKADPIRIVDVGAASHGRLTEPYASLLQAGCARVLGFEPDIQACDELNRLYRGSENGESSGDASCVYIPKFVGDGQPGTYHETSWSMTGSLFKPNTPLLERFDQLGEVVALKATHPVKTVRLVDLPEATEIDMIKIDVQGAELAVFEGAAERLDQVLMIWTEVEFIPLYEKQPLFRDVDRFLTERGFLLHSFDALASRRFKAFVSAGGERLRRAQVLWADAIYVRDFRSLAELSTRKLKKLALLLDQVAGADDLCFEVLRLLDENEGTNSQSQFIADCRVSRPREQTSINGNETQSRFVRPQVGQTTYRHVFCAGMARSASTWSYNVVKRILARTHGPECYGGGYVGEGASLDFSLAESDRAGTRLLLKFHDPTPAVLDRVARGEARVVLTYRNPLNALASRMDLFGESTEIAAEAVAASIEHLCAWIRTTEPLLLSFDDVTIQPEAAVEKLARFLGIDLPVSAIQNISRETDFDAAKKKVASLDDSRGDLIADGESAYDPESLLHVGHVSLGRARDWRTQLTPEQHGYVLKRLDAWIDADGNWRPDALHLKGTT